MSEIKYHYSPKTGKPEVCRVAGDKVCPYSGYPHFWDLKECQKFADDLNRSKSKSKSNKEELLKTDWDFAVPKYYSNINRNYIELEDIAQILGYDVKEFEDRDFYIIPKSTLCVQNFLGDMFKLSEEIIEDVNHGISKGQIQKAHHGQLYNKWKAIDLLKYFSKENNVLLKEIKEANPNNNTSFTIADIWKDFLEIRRKDRLLREYNPPGSNGFYILSYNKGPRSFRREVENNRFNVKEFHTRRLGEKIL